MFPRKIPAGPEFLLGHGPQVGEDSSRLRRLYRRWCNTKKASGEEGESLGRVTADVGGGVHLASAGGLHRHVEAPPTGMGSYEVHHTGGCIGFTDGGGCLMEEIPPEPLPWGISANNREGGHPNYCQASRSGTSRYDHGLP